MNLRKHMGLIIGGGITLVLLIVALALLFRVRKVYATVNAELRERTQRLNMLNQRDPFPSEENVELARQKLDAMQTFFTNLTSALHAGQVEPVQMEPAEFPPLLERTVRALLSRAATPAARVKLPDRFAFGFDRYLLGDLPAAEDIPRLVVQLKSAERICGMLFDARISELTEIKRSVFEKRADTRAAEETVDLRRRRVMADVPEVSAPPETEAEGLFGRERFELRFSARESAVWELLNRMASSGMFIVVTDLQLANKAGARAALAKPAPGPTAAPAPAAMPAGRFGWPGAAPAPVERVLSHDERVLAGREEVEVRLVIETYRFLIRGTQEVTP